MNMEESLIFESRARTRRFPISLTIIFIMFLTMGLDVEQEWAGQRMSRHRGANLLYSGEQKLKDAVKMELDELQQTYGQGPKSESKVWANEDISKSYKGNWCLKKTDDRLQLYPAFKKECGTLALKLNVGMGKKSTNETLPVVETSATLVIEDHTIHDLTTRLHGEYRTEPNQIVLLGSMHDMFMKQKRNDSSYTPYSPCRIRMFLEMQGNTKDGNDSVIEEHKKVPNSSEKFQFEVEEDSGENLVKMKGIVESVNCGWQLKVDATSLNMIRSITKVTNYCLLMITVAICQIALLIHQVRQPPSPSVSLLSLGQQAMIDSYLCLIHLTAGIVADAMFSPLATAAFCEFVVFSMFEMRYLIACSNSRQNNQTSWFDIQSDIGTIYGRFYGLLLAGIVFVYEFKEQYWLFAFIFYSFWVPQIYRNAVHAYRQPLKPMYIIGMSLCRLALPFYIFGCPNNFLKAPYNPRMCFWLFIYMAFQVGLLLLQYYRGSRYFIPKFLLPEQYNYYRKLSMNEAKELNAKFAEEGGCDCVICMTAVDVNDASARMVTPCNHFFHPECLDRWLKVKMECPTCRRALPPNDY